MSKSTKSLSLGGDGDVSDVIAVIRELRLREESVSGSGLERRADSIESQKNYQPQLTIHETEKNYGEPKYRRYINFI